MVDDNELKRLGSLQAPAPSARARRPARWPPPCRRSTRKIPPPPPKDRKRRLRLTDRAWKIWREMMQKKLLAAPALTALVALPIAGYATFYLMEEFAVPFRRRTRSRMDPRGAPGRNIGRTCEGEEGGRGIGQPRCSDPASGPAGSRRQRSEAPANYAAPRSRTVAGCQRSCRAGARRSARGADACRGRFRAPVAASKMMADQSARRLRADGPPAAGRGGPRPLRGIQDQPGALGGRPTRSRPSRSMSTRRPIPSCAAR